MDGRCARARRRRDAGRDARGRAADLPGAVLRRPLAGPRRLPAAHRARRPTSAPTPTRCSTPSSRARSSRTSCTSSPLQPPARRRSRDSSPRYAHVVLGDGDERDGRPAPLRRAAPPRRAAARARRRGDRPSPTYPEPVAHCAICALADECRRSAGRRRPPQPRRRRAPRPARAPRRARHRDGAGARRRAAEHVERRPLGRRALRAAAPPGRPAGRTRATAAQPTHRHLPPARAAGYALLPEPSPGDIFFDLEGDPYVGRRRHRVPLGLVDGRRPATSASGRTTSTPRRRRSSGSSTASSSCARAHPGMHVFHYAPHERRKLRSLALEVRDARGPRSTTCCATTCSSTSTPSCARASGRRGELLAEEARAPPRLRAPREARARGRRLDRRLRELAGDRATTTLLEAIRAYNEEDCRSTASLFATGSLDEMRPEAAAQFGVDFDELREARAEDETYGRPMAAGRARADRAADRRTAGRRRTRTTPSRPSGACSPSCCSTTTARASRRGGATSTCAARPLDELDRRARGHRPGSSSTDASTPVSYKQSLD